MIQVPMWAVWLFSIIFLGLSLQLLIVLFCRRALGQSVKVKQDLARAMRMYLARSNQLYLVGRIRRAAGQNTVWDVMGLFTTKIAARKGCTGKLDFYMRLNLDQVQNDNNYKPAPAIFPNRKAKVS